jgi:hypothetical protein
MMRRWQIGFGLLLLFSPVGLLGGQAAWASGHPAAHKVKRVAAVRHGGKAARGRHQKGQRNPLQRFRSVDAAHKRAVLEVIAGLGGQGGGFNFDGAVNGRLVFTIPKGWHVLVHFKNEGNLNHSAVVVANASATSPAFPGAGTPDPTVGQPPGGTASFSFLADKVGTYRLACLVPGHEGAGMWVTLRVVGAGRPTIASH